MLISKAYRELNAKLHSTNERYGSRGSMWGGTVLAMIKALSLETVLDYGCGKGALATLLATEGITVAEYDPAIEGKDAAPEPADLVVCTDVLEHIEPALLNAVLRDLKRVTQKRLLLNISTRAADKVLEDGRNAHLIVRDNEWWREKLVEHFQVMTWTVRGHDKVMAELVPHHPRLIRMASHTKVQRRRDLTRDLEKLFVQLTEQSAKYNDAFSRIETIRMWEGVDDQPADMQCVCNLLEQLEDVDAALVDMLQKASKGLMIMTTLDAVRTEAAWRRVLERRLRISDWHVKDGGLVCIGTPMVGVQGLTAVGVVGEDERWKQVQASMARFPGRIAFAPAHDRIAILACYGPSLGPTMDILKREAANPNADVFSVSGSHDFLLGHGVVPTFHVECDPRPHKADNIDRAHPDVTYMIASCVHAQLTDKLPVEQVKLWHCSSSDHTPKLVDEYHENPHTLVSGGGSVGLRAIPLLYTLGYRNYYIFAMDCSFADEGKTQWAGKHAGKRQDLIQVEVGGRYFVSSPQLATYATNFFETIQKTSDIDYRLYGDGLLQAMVNYYARTPDTIERAQSVAA